MVRTARTLPEGEGDFSMSMNLARISVEEQDLGGGVTSPGASFTFPNVIPELIYNYGITDDLELGGKISLGTGLLELGAKYRFLGGIEEKYHLAVAPAIGYRAVGLVSGPVFTLPVMATYDLNPNISVSGGPLVSYSVYSTPDDLGDDDVNIGGDTLYGGLGAGIQFRTLGGFHFMPSVEYQRSLSRSGDFEDAPGLNILFLAVTFGWGPNQREIGMDKKLDRIEDKIDKLGE